MSAPFYQRIRTALGDPDLQAALDANADRRLQVTQQAFASLEDPQAMRQRAHDVRAGVIADLEGHLERFAARVRANGIRVHAAADARQAVDLVSRIAQEAGARRVAKSKTMVSEEIGLNHALEAAGLHVVETDLGEYIVQLRGERPSHIITPAVHLRREQVGQTFHEKLGIPLTGDITALTTAARRQLRREFLEADVGVSGVNFGVVESGTLCLVTNEGNGRMVTTLPRMHIALMGIERLVPTLEDLALMLALLPRAATGQKITVYTTLIHSPRRPGESDGPLSRHLILVDNGRRATRESPLAEALLCIRCGACLNACPVFREIGGHAYTDVQGESSVYPGPIGSVISPALFGQSNFGHLARASTLCGACREACPVDIDLPKLLLRTRAGGVDAPARPVAAGESAPRGIPRLLAWGLRVYTWLAKDVRRFAAAQRLAALAAGRFSSRGSWLRLPAFTGWGRDRRFPPPAARPFRSRYASLARAAPESAGTPRSAPPPAATPAPKVESGPSPTPDREGLISRFAAELAALGGGFTRCTEGEIGERVLAALQERQATQILTWHADHLPAGLLDRLAAGGIHTYHSATDFLDEAGGEIQDRTPEVGLTGSLGAVAETGTLVLPGGAGQPLAASLLPATHLAVLRAEDIYENLAKVLSLRKVQEASSVALVSGPSRTADIEMTLTIGVHGPKEVHVFCVT